MNIKRILFCYFLMLISCITYAQDLEINFKNLGRTLVSQTDLRYDNNEEPCAIIRVSGADIETYKFESKWIMGDVVYTSGEARVYMAQGAKFLTIKSNKFGLMKYEFPESLEKKTEYRLELKVVLSPDKKTRTLVMPVMGIGKAPSYGIMLGIVKKWGAYVKVMHSFNGQSTDFTCDELGNIDGGSQKAWLTGEKANSRFSITGGVMYRVALPVYFYLGAGYGYKKLAWEMEGNKWAEVSDHTTTGLESEVGIICRIKNVALSAGVQNNQFKNWDATVGVALMF